MFGDPELESIKNKSYMTKKFTKQTEQARLLANSQYEKTLEIKSLQNRVIAFEGLNPHGVENFTEDLDEDRVTLIGFFHHISASGLKYPTVQSRKSLVMYQDILKYTKTVDHYNTHDFSVFLYSLIKMQKPKCVLELGTGFGVTAFLAAQACKENNKGKVITIDNGVQWDQLTKYEHYMQHSTIKDSL